MAKEYMECNVYNGTFITWDNIMLQQLEPLTISCCAAHMCEIEFPSFIFTLTPSLFPLFLPPFPTFAEKITP